MKRIKKCLVILIIAAFVLPVAACDFDDIGGGATLNVPDSINVPYKAEGYNFLEWVNGTSGVNVDASGVDFNKLGNYQATFSIAGTSLSKTVDVEVALATQKSIADNDKELFAQLLGRELTDTEKYFLDAGAALRLKNYTVVTYPGTDLLGNDIEVNSALTANFNEVEEIIFNSYMEMWYDYLSNAEINEKNIAEINWMLGRKLTAAESEKMGEMIDLINAYTQSNPGADIFDATTAEISALNPAPTTEAINLYFTIKSELLAKLYMVKSSAANEIDYDAAQLNAILTMSQALFPVNYAPQGEEPLPYDPQTFAEIVGVTLTQEQTEAYGTFRYVQNMILFNMIEPDIESPFGQLNETEKNHLLNIIYILWNANFQGEEDFINSQLYEIEELLNHQLHEVEIDGYYYLKTLFFIKEYVPQDRVLTEEEKNFLTLALILQNEYLSMQEQDDPNFDENLTEEQFIEVTERQEGLSEDEIAALALYFSLLVN